METQHTYFSRFDNLWGKTDLFESDLERTEFDSNFDYKHEEYQSIIDSPSLMNAMSFDEEEEESLYPEEVPEGDPASDPTDGYQFI